jgi:hypothetical protein
VHMAGGGKRGPSIHDIKKAVKAVDKRVHRKGKGRPKVQPRRARLPRVRPSSGGESLFNDYSMSLQNPFKHTPPSLGYGRSSADVQKLIAYLRLPFATPIGGCWAAILNPNACCATTSGTLPSNLLEAFLGFAIPGAIGSPLVSGTQLANAYATPNCSTNNTLIQLHRIISAQLRVSVSGSSAGIVPGYLGAIRLPGLYPFTLLDTLTINNLMQMLAGEYQLASATEGASGSQNYVPLDDSDFEFTQNIYGNAAATAGASAASGGFAQALIVYGWGWPVGLPMKIEAMVHMEGVAGTLQAAISDPAAPPNESRLVDHYPSPSALMSRVGQVPNIGQGKIIPTTLPPEPEWARTLRGHLRTGRGLAHEAGKLWNELTNGGDEETAEEKSYNYVTATVDGLPGPTPTRKALPPGWRKLGDSTWFNSNDNTYYGYPPAGYENLGDPKRPAHPDKVGGT